MLFFVIKQDVLKDINDSQLLEEIILLNLSIVIPILFISSKDILFVNRLFFSLVNVLLSGSYTISYPLDFVATEDRNAKNI